MDRLAAKRHARRRWYEKHRLEQIARVRAWQVRHAAAIKASSAAWQRAHKVRRNTIARERYRTNIECEHARERERYLKRAQAKRASVQRWAKLHPEAAHRRGATRRARRRHAFVESVDRQVVYERDGGVCGVCHCPVWVRIGTSITSSRWPMAARMSTEMFNLLIGRVMLARACDRCERTPGVLRCRS